LLLQFIRHICSVVKETLTKTIGILGGGQLGKMLFEAGSSLNLNYVFLEKTADCPAGLINKNQIIGDLNDADKVYELAAKADVVSYEIEHVNTNALLKLEQEGKLIIPKPSVLQTIQDKGLQKAFYDANGVATLPFVLCTTQNLAEKVNEWRDDAFVLKHRTGGYDGKGVQVLNKAQFNKLVDNEDSSIQNPSGFVIEKYLDNVTEVSVIVAIGQSGDCIAYEPCEMVFDPKSNLMDYLIAPSHLAEAIQQNCKDIALQVVKSFNSAGLFAVELFVDEQKAVFVNEIAPRPHNSGHHTIESCITSQYEQLNRILLGLPLGDTRLINAAITCNIVGPENVQGAYYIDNLEEIMKLPGVYIHMYGKTTTSPFRKLGHFTVINETQEDAIAIMKKVKYLLQLKSVNLK
jgi:5-(carboxyamino)imidazole ribonucleotide synthase